MFARKGCLALFALLLLARAAAGAEGCPVPSGAAKDEWEAQGAWQAAERAGLRVGEIKIEVTDVYESSEAWYARAVNFLHVETREQVVRELLLLEPADAVDARVVYESARRMRELGYFREVSILPLACHDGVVDVAVRAKDAWTLIFYIKANRAGGQNNTGFRIEDRNFLGTGKVISFGSEEEATRTTASFNYEDPALLGSRWRLGMRHEDQSDGRFNGASLALPFVSTKQVWGFEFRSSDLEETQSFYQDGEIAWEAPLSDRLNTAMVWRLVTRDADSGWRAGLGLRSQTRGYGAAVAIDPTLRPTPDLVPFSDSGFTLALSRFHDHFSSFHNLRLIDKTEDINLGLDATLALTLPPEFFGGVTDGARVAFDAGWAGRPREGWVLRFELESAARKQQADWRDGLVSAAFTAYAQSGRHTRLAQLGLEWRDDPDPEHEAMLGGDDGMLGYPQHWLVGDRVFKLHLEDRWSTDLVLFQTLRVGYTVIAEVGGGRRIDTRQWSQTLANIGAGLRLGNLRGAYGQVIYITAFVPLVLEPGVDSWQVVIGDVIEF
jgi:hypothetical protein